MQIEGALPIPLPAFRRNLLQTVFVEIPFLSVRYINLALPFGEMIINIVAAAHVFCSDQHFLGGYNGCSQFCGEEILVQKGAKPSWSQVLKSALLYYYLYGNAPFVVCRLFDHAQSEDYLWEVGAIELRERKTPAITGRIVSGETIRTAEWQ